MEYTVKKLAQLSWQTPRTIRHYDEIGLLKPKRISSNGYRIYGEEQVNRLQQILFYRELGFELKAIQEILDANGFRVEQSLEGHIAQLTQQKNRLETMITQAQKTLNHLKEGTTMPDKEKFEAFKQQLIQDNEEQYGGEIRQKYGEETVERANKQFMNMTQEEYQAFEQLGHQVLDTLGRAMETKNPASELAQEACRLHKEWIAKAWGRYDPEAHMGVVEMYTTDERFAKHYEDGAGTGAAQFLLEAMKHFLAR